MDDARDRFGWVGATIDGKYRVDRAVTQGGFGILYRAHHLGFDQTVAVKCLRMPATLTERERNDFRKMFLAEGRLLHKLSRATTGIVQALDVGSAFSPKGVWTPYLVLEWLDGKTLAKDLEERRSTGLGPRPLTEATDLLGTAARALATAHSQGVVHRDVTPANLFIANVAGQSVMKVLDFGIAKEMSAQPLPKAFEETGRTLRAFSARYAAPEHFTRRFGATGPWTDVYSLALVLIEVTTLRHALQGTDADQLFLATSNAEERPTLRRFGLETSDEVEVVLCRALSVDPRHRYPNVGEFWEALERAVFPDRPLETVVRPMLPSSTEPESLVPNMGRPWAPEEATQKPHVVTVPVRPRMRRALFALGTILFVALLVVATYWFVSGRWVASAPDAAPSVAVASANAAALSSEVMSSKVAMPSASTSGLPPVPPMPSASAAPSAELTPSASGSAVSFPGVPTRDVEGGIIGSGVIGGYRLLVRDTTIGVDLLSAAKGCSDVGLSLCTNPQWTRACSAFPEIGVMPSWTSSLDGDNAVVRGGEGCDTETRAPITEGAPGRYGLCCGRAVAVTGKSLNSSFLASTDDRILAIERALNQRDIPAFLAESERIVAVDGVPKSAAALRTVLGAAFEAEPQLVVLNDTCDISVRAKKITKRTKRKTKVYYQTLDWSALCQQTLLLPDSVRSREATYIFSATSQLRGYSITR